MAVAALLGIHQAFDRGRGRTQNHGRLSEMAADHRHVAGLIGDALLLLIALVVLLIDDDEAEIGEGEKQGRAGADHELRLVLRHGAPDAAAHRRGDAGMPLGRAGAEPLLAARNELIGERDLGHQHQHLAAARERRGDRLEINFGLARAGNAVEQSHGEAVASVVEQLARGFGLLHGELGALAGKIERHGMPVGQRLGDQSTGIDQPVDNTRADAGGFGETRLDPDQPVLRCFEHARARRGHARRLPSSQPHAIALSRRVERASGAHHHAQDHAGRRQSVARHPVGEVERDARQRRHVVD